MKKLLVFWIILALLGVLNAQGSGDEEVEEIRARYNEANRDWRLSAVMFVLNNEEENIAETIEAMEDFTATTRSYVDLNRPGYDLALHLFYLNLENIRKLEQLELRLNERREDFENVPEESFAERYEVEEGDFYNYDRFNEKYEEIMDTWRAEYEVVLAGEDIDGIQQIRQDMMLLRAAIEAFVLFPGDSASRVPDLQRKQRDLRHAILTLQTHIAGIAADTEEEDDDENG